MKFAYLLATILSLLFSLFIPDKQHFFRNEAPPLHIASPDTFKKDTVFLDENKLPSLLFTYYDSLGCPKEFVLNVTAEVCSEGLCELAMLTIVWNRIGKYKKFILPENYGLTKYDHKPFSKSDYEKLHIILADPQSVLKTIKKDDLVMNTNKTNSTPGVDALSGATPKTLKNHLVEGAAYTTHTFWHIVNGPLRDSLENIFIQCADTSMLLNMLNGENKNECLWSIKRLREQYQNNTRVIEQMKDLWAHPDQDIAKSALGFFENHVLENPTLQEKLMHTFTTTGTAMKYEILYRLKALDSVSEKTIETLLRQFIAEEIGASGYMHIHTIMKKVENPSQSILSMNIKLLDHWNFYVAKKSYQYLQTIPEKRKIEKKLRKFERKHKDRL